MIPAFFLAVTAQGDSSKKVVKRLISALLLWPIIRFPSYLTFFQGFLVRAASVPDSSSTGVNSARLSKPLTSTDGDAVLKNLPVKNVSLQVVMVQEPEHNITS